jgi:hypothetical protein
MDNFSKREGDVVTHLGKLAKMRFVRETVTTIGMGPLKVAIDSRLPIAVSCGSGCLWP